MQLWCVVGTVKKKQSHSSLRESLTRFRRGSVTRDAPPVPLPPRHPFFPTYLPCPGSQPATLEKGLLPSLLHSIPFHFGSFEFGMPSSSSLPPPIAIAIALLFTHSAATTKSSDRPTDARGAGGQSGKSRGHRRLSRGGRFIIHGILIWNHP